MFSKETLTKDQRFIFDKENKMIYEIIPAWVNYKYDFKNELYPEKHNALHRTSLALIAYKDKELLEGVKDCFRKFGMINYPKNKYWYQACRCNPRMWEDDVSRDQIIMALTALHITDKDSAKEIAGHLPFKLSRRFNMVPSMYFWVKYLHSEKKIHLNLFSFTFFIETLFSFIFSFIGIFLNIKQLIYHSYALHLSAWQLYILPGNKLNRLIQKMLLKILKDRDEKNYLVRKLLGDKKITRAHFNSYFPMNSWRWEVYKKHTDRYLRHLSPSEAAANIIDKDIIDFLFLDK